MKKPSPIVCLSTFQILKEVYLKMLKKTEPNCLLIPFSNIKKSILKNLQKNLVQFFADHLFQILKEVYLQILSKT